MPALLFGVGALGFFAVPCTIVVYPMVFLVAPRLWSVSHARGYVTPADFVRGRFRSGSLALMVAITGIAPRPTRSSRRARATDGVLPGDAAVLGYSTLACGSALALFLYPHSVTGVLAARSRDTIKRNMAALPLYSIVLGLLALLG